MHKDELLLLEAMIDRYGAAELLDSVMEICAAKAEHIAVNWQDVRLAKRWAKLSGAVATAVTQAADL